MPGPPPKDPRTRARANKDPIPLRIVDLPSEALLPETPPTDLLRTEDGERWHPGVLRWWTEWRESPLGQNLPDTDVAEFEICALLLQEFYTGGRRAATIAEFRQRMAAFGSTPADRARLRIVAADADQKEAKKAAPRKAAASPARRKYGSLAVLRQNPEQAG